MQKLAKKILIIALLIGVIQAAIRCRDPLCACVRARSRIRACEGQRFGAGSVSGMLHSYGAREGEQWVLKKCCP